MSMCDPTSGEGKRPHYRLADLIERELDVRVDPAALRLFLRANWESVTRLAHLIHGKADRPRIEAGE
jgi:hypothetical protein